ERRRAQLVERLHRAQSEEVAKLVLCAVTLPASWVASTKRCKDAGSVHSFSMDATEDAAARRVIAGQGAGERCRAHHSIQCPSSLRGLNLEVVSKCAAWVRNSRTWFD